MTQRLLFSGSVEKPHYDLHIAKCEDKTVAQLIEPKDNLITVDVKNGLHQINIYIATIHRSHLITIITKTIDTISNSYQPIW